MMTTPAAPGGDREIVAAPVHCRRCGYNLFGLRADGVCPECGLETWASIVHTVDPSASRLPRLRNPDAIGNALLWLMTCFALAALLLVLRPLAVRLDALDRSGLRNLAAWTPHQLSLLAGIVVLAALRGLFWLVPHTSSDSTGPVWRDIWLLGCGLGAWSVLAISAATLELMGVAGGLIGALQMAMAAAAIVALLGLRGILGLIGMRSREYRTARGGRQSIQAMIAAIVGLAVGQALHLMAPAASAPRGLHTLGTVLTGISVLMLLIGLSYLVVNAWWIRRSLRSPAPGWEQILRDATPPPGHAAAEEPGSPT